jgi:predicted lipoprotein
MGLWQQAEVMQIGPTASMSAAPEGMDMRDEVYSWPTVNTCRIDQEITEDAHADQAVFGTELANVRGLDALEYLLFAEELENSCSANSGINKKGTWEDLLTAGELPARRAAYILTAASLLENVTQSILTAWRKDGGDFHTSFATAGAGSEVYDSAQQALNRVSDALFYVEKQTKDMKLALPAGVGGGCDDDACPEYLESTFAMASKEHILNNLAGARYLMIGSRDEAADALGLLDVLEDAGAADLGADMLARLDEANSFISSIEGPLAEALSTNPEIVVEAHDKVKAFSDLLKTEFITTLDLDIPKRAAGDND